MRKTAKYKVLSYSYLEDMRARNKPYDISIAIHFGTDGLGVAYALPNSTRIHVHDKWKSKKYGSIVKPKTIILFDENLEVINVGLVAKHAYIDLPNQRDNWMLFERFKMSLFGVCQLSIFNHVWI